MPLKNLIAKISSRFFENFTIPSGNEYATLNFEFKYGMDGTSDVSYMQKNDREESQNTVEHILCSTTVPLRLKNQDTGEILWENPTPNSTKYCVPIRLRFAKETSDICKDEEMHLKSQLENLPSIVVETCTIMFKFYLTMIDGKVSIIYF